MPIAPPSAPAPATAMPDPVAHGSRGGHQLIVMPDDTIRPIVEAIDSARRSMELCMFVLEHKLLLRALVAARTRGVHVRVMLNLHHRNGQAQNLEAFELLRGAGVQVRGCHPRFELTHQKSLVIDHRLAFVQSMNWDAHLQHRTRDYAVVTQDAQEIDEIVAGFDADWNQVIFEPRSDSRLIWCPDNGRSRLTAFIDAATRSLWVQNERYQDEVIIERLVRAHLRGVDVHILTGRLHTLRVGQLNEALGGLRILQDVGIKVHIAKHIRLHAKMMLADSARAIVGSINLSPGSFNHRRELAIETHEVHAVARLERIASKDWAHSKRFDCTRKNSLDGAIDT